MQFKSNSIIRLLMIPMVGMLWFGCGLERESESASNLNVAVSVEIASLDPQTTTSVDAIKIQSALFETLVRIDAERGAIRPAGALQWEILEGGLTYRFALNPDLKWSDGKPVTASDYVFAIRRLMTPALAAPFAPLYYGIKGAEQAHQDASGDSASIVGIKALSEYQLEIQLEHVVPYFLSLLARPCVAALPEHAIVAADAVTSRMQGWSLKPGFPSSGPYQLEDWKVNKHILLKKNPMYPASEQIEFDRIHFYSIESAYSQERGFLSGALDVTSKLASERVWHFENTASYVNQLEMGTFYVITNTESDALSHADLRRALSRAIDRQVIVRQLRRRGEQPATTFTPPLWRGYHPEMEVLETDGQGDLPHEAGGLDRNAKPVLAGGRKLRFLIASSESNLQIAEALQSMWSETLGMEVDIVRQEWKSYLDSRKRGNFDLCLATWIGDYFDPLTFLEMWKTGAPNNFCRWHEADYDALLEKAEHTVDPAQRFDILAQAEQKLMRESPILPIFYLSRVYLKNPAIEVWPQTILNTIDYTRVRRNEAFRK